MTERANVVTFRGGPLTLVGAELKTGSQAPEFKLVGGNLADVESSAYAGKVRVLSVAPSVDTPVCAVQTRTFNKQATELSDDVVIIGASMDLPFALARFCAAEGIESVVMASDYRYRGFGEAYGVHIRELGLLTRAVFVIDRENVVRHAEYVSEMTSEPDYAAALDAVKAAL